MSFLSRENIEGLGFKELGDNVLLSDKASVYNPGNICIGSNVRIDDFCVLSAGTGGIVINSNVHVAVYSSVIGSGRVVIEDFANLSSRVSIYSSNDDYSGESMTNPTVPDLYKNVKTGPVFIRKHVIVGSGTVILPDVDVGEGAAVGAMSLVNRSLDPWGVYAGQPAKLINFRSRKLLDLEREFKKES